MNTLLDASLSSIAALLASCALTAMGVNLEFPCDGKWFVAAVVLFAAAAIGLVAARKRLPQVGRFTVLWGRNGGIEVRIRLLPADTK